MIRIPISILLVCVFGAGVLSADSIVLPGAAEGNSNNTVPFGLGSAYMAPEITGRYQQVYGAGSFSTFGASSITEIAFRLDQSVVATPGSSTLDNLLIALAVTTRNVDGLNLAFANNLTSAAAIVYSGPVSFSWSASSGPQRPFDLRIPLQQPFWYDPGLGNLLLDISVIGGNTVGSSTFALDAAQGADGVSRVWATSPASNGWQVSSGTADTIGLVTAFTATPVPEPGTGGLVLLGSALLAGFTLRRRRLNR